MADFSVSATQLSAPQGAGANTVQAVQQAAPDTSGLLTSPALASIVDVFAKGLVSTRQEDAAKKKAMIVNGYIREETIFNEAVASGQMNASQAAARSKANFNKYAAGYGEYIEDFEKAGKALRGFTEKGDVEKTLEIEGKRREADIAQAQARGFEFPVGMSEAYKDSQIKAAKTGIVAEQELSKFYQERADRRAQAGHDAGVEAKAEKDLAFKLVNEVAGSNLIAFQDFAKATSDAVRTGKMTQAEAMAAMSSRYSNISGMLAAGARTNPELAAPFKSLFDTVYQVGKEMADPKANLTAMETKLSEATTKMTLVAMANPKAAPLIVANKLMPNNLQLQTRVEAVALLAALGAKPIGDGSFTPTFVGDPDTEPEVLKLLKAGLRDLKDGKISDKEIATLQAGNSVNHILSQTSELISKKGVNPASLKGLATFFASSEYAGLIASGVISKEAAGAAQKTLQVMFEPVVVDAIQKRLAKPLDTGSIYSEALLKPGSKELLTVADAVTLKFTGSGVTFEAKPIKNLTPAAVVAQREMLEGLREAQQGINQLIHIGAHLEASTDYSKFWESNKHVYMPNTYPDPKKLAVGQVVTAKNGKSYKYLGGDFNDIENSFQEVKNGTSK